MFINAFQTNAFSQWIQSSFSNPSSAIYNIALQLLGDGVSIGTSSDPKTGNLLVQNTITAAKFVDVYGGAF